MDLPVNSRSFTLAIGYHPQRVNIVVCKPNLAILPLNFHINTHLGWTNMLHSRPFFVPRRLKSHSSLLTFDLRRPNAQSWKLFTEDLGSPLIFKISESSRLLFINSYLTLDIHITTHSFWRAKTIHANSGLL